jgi:1-acyl-sn-glycerol-3-phosphate acyltransferase
LPGNNAPDHENIRETIQAYLLAGRAVVLMQADSVHRSVYHPYIGRFKKGAADVAHELLTGEHGLEVPVTPISIYGAEGLLTIGKRIIVRIGEPMTIRPFLEDPRPVEKFTAALEERVAELVRQDVEKYGMPKRKFQKYVRREI